MAMKTVNYTLKKPNEVYLDLYKEARKEAKEAKKNAISAFLKAKKIKDTYSLEEIDDSDDDLILCFIQFLILSEVVFK